MRLLSPLVSASLALAAVALAPLAAHAQSMPMRKAGLWEMTMTMSSPMTMKNTMQTCTDASNEAKGAAFNNNAGGASGVTCTSGPVLPSPGGWRYSQTCTMKNMTMHTEGTASGDFASGYHMDSTTTMSPAPIPQMAQNHMTIDAKWLGPCPAGMEAGDAMVNGRKVSARKP